MFPRRNCVELNYAEFTLSKELAEALEMLTSRIVMCFCPFNQETWLKTWYSFLSAVEFLDATNLLIAARVPASFRACADTADSYRLPFFWPNISPDLVY